MPFIFLDKHTNKYDHAVFVCVSSCYFPPLMFIHKKIHTTITATMPNLRPFYIATYKLHSIPEIGNLRENPRKNRQATQVFTQFLVKNLECTE